MNANWTNSFLSTVLFVIYLIISCGGLYLVKVAEEWKTATFFVGFGLYGTGAVLWMVILRLLPLSFAFPVAAGALVIGTMLTGSLFLSEQISRGHIAGAFMVIGGIALIVNSR